MSHPTQASLPRRVLASRTLPQAVKIAVNAARVTNEMVMAVKHLLRSGDIRVDKAAQTREVRELLVDGGMDGERADCAHPRRTDRGHERRRECHGEGDYERHGEVDPTDVGPAMEQPVALIGCSGPSGGRRCVRALYTGRDPSPKSVNFSNPDRRAHSFRATSGPVIRLRSGNVEAMIASEAASPPRTVAQYAIPGMRNAMPTWEWR